MKRRVVGAVMGLALLGVTLTAGLTPGQTNTAEAAQGECGELLWAALYHAEQGNWDYVYTLADWWHARGCSF